MFKIERSDTTTGRVVFPSTANFAEGKVAEVELYEETADVKKQAFVREKVSVRKEVERETVHKSVTIRREELKVDADGEIIEK